MKQFFSVLFLFTFLWCSSIFAQDSMELSPNLEQTSNNPSMMIPWDVEFSYDAEAVTSANGNAGVVYIPTIGKFWTSRWATTVFHQWNADGTLDMEFNLAFSGTRNMAFDGQYVYCSTSTTTVQIVDPSNLMVVGTVSVPAAPNGFRAMTYNPDGDGGNGSLIGGNWTAPNLDFYEYSLTGTLLQTIPNTVTGVYGLAYDNWSPGGPFLWVWGQGLGAGQPQLINQMDYSTLTYTGFTHDVRSDVGAGQPTTTGIAGGLFITDQLISGEVTLGGMWQGTPDLLFGYELTTSGGGGNVIYEDNFDAYTAGAQLACQNPIDWTTWSNAPCGSEDPFVSNAFSSSPSNSVNVILNNDLLKLFPQMYTSGKYSMAFQMYIPTGLTGYFNCLSSWNNGSPQWAMQVYFNNAGQGNMDAGVALAHPFTYPHDSWMDVVVIANLDDDVGEFWLNGVMEYTWQWSLGTFGTGELALEANNFFGGGTDGTPDYYFDNYVVTDITIIPVELTSFAANVTNLGQVMLNWETATEINNQGFEIERRSESSDYRTVGFVDGYGTTTEHRTYSYLDQTVEQGVNYYRLKQVDFDGTFSYSDEIEVDVTGPLAFNLDQNYPNPFNPSTNINFSIPESGNVRLAIYNLVGEEVAILVDGFRPAGFYEATFDASNLPSGVYLYKLQSANSVQTKKMMLLK